jgi:SAM-dependent methyltransferase
MDKRNMKNVISEIDDAFINLDRKRILRTKNIRLIPGYKNRVGGKNAYSEWAHVVGIFQTLICQNLKYKSSNHILDIGCGNGLLGISAEPFVSDGGKYTGIDVVSDSINFCRDHYQMPNFNFILHEVNNTAYTLDQDSTFKPWSIDDNSQDLVTALSVWTHLNEQDALYYFSEINRVLKKGSRAIITFFYLDSLYFKTLKMRSDDFGRYHQTKQSNWIFNKPAYESLFWFTPNWTKHPEDAIGINQDGLNLLLKKSDLKLIEIYQGNWKEIPGVYFQDVLIFEK